MVQLVLLLCVTWLGDWTEFRGSNADGRAAGPATPLVWSDSQNVAWKSELPGLGWSSPAIAEGVVYLTTAVTNGSVVPQPVIGHGMVFYNHDYDHPELLAVKLGGKGDVTESHVVWRIQRGAPSTPSPLLVGDELYYVSDKGIASCVDAKTGAQHWMERLGGNFSASPVFANGLILFLDEDGHAHWSKPSKTFEVVQRNEVTGRTLATPAFVDGAMYLRTDKALLKIAQ